MEHELSPDEIHHARLRQSHIHTVLQLHRQRAFALARPSAQRKKLERGLSPLLVESHCSLRHGKRCLLVHQMQEQPIGRLRKLISESHTFIIYSHVDVHEVRFQTAVATVVNRVGTFYEGKLHGVAAIPHLGAFAVYRLPHSVGLRVADRLVVHVVAPSAARVERDAHSILHYLVVDLHAEFRILYNPHTHVVDRICHSPHTRTVGRLPESEDQISVGRRNGLLDNIPGGHVGSNSKDEHADAQNTQSESVSAIHIILEFSCYVYIQIC